MDSKYIVILLLCVLIQQPSFTVAVELSKSFYQPGETITVDITICNGLSAKECLKSMDVTVADEAKLLCSITDTYPADTECVEPGEEGVYTILCDVPPNAVEGVGTVDVEIKTWNNIEIRAREYFEIGVNYPPEISIVSFPPVVNPSQQYSVTFSVYDNFGVEDIASAELVLYHESTHPSERECYLFFWESLDPYTVWDGDNLVSADASIQNNEIIWTLTIFVSEIASPGEWTLEITVYDVPHQHHQVAEQVFVTKYLSYHVEGTSRGLPVRINFGKAEPGGRLPTTPLTVVVTSNAQVNILVQGDDLYSPEGGVLPVDIFSVESPMGGLLQMNGSRQAVLPMYAEKNGFNKEVRILLLFSGVLPEVVEAGTYSAIWYIIVEVV